MHFRKVGESLYLRSDQLDIGHGNTIDQIAIDEQSDFNALIGETDDIRKRAYDIVRLGVPLECVVAYSLVTVGGACDSAASRVT